VAVEVLGSTVPAVTADLPWATVAVEVLGSTVPAVTAEVPWATVAVEVLGSTVPAEPNGYGIIIYIILHNQGVFYTGTPGVYII